MRARQAAAALLLVLAWAGCGYAQQRSIQGRVSDTQGEAVRGAFVTAGRLAFHGGRWRVVSTTVMTTSDDGVYRFDGLTPGKYRVSAAFSSGSADPLSFFFPSSPEEAGPARLVTVADGLLSVDLVMSRVPTARISGRVFDTNGRPRTSTLYIMPSDRSGAIALPLHGALIAEDGSFRFNNVPPGEWVIQSIEARHNPSTEGAFAGAFVSMDGVRVEGIELRWTQGSSITGTVTFANDEPIPQGQFTVFPAPADLDETPLVEGELAHAEVQQDQTFELRGIHGPRRLLLSAAPAGWILQRVIVDGIDVTDKPIRFGTDSDSIHDVEMVVTRRTSELSGRVVDEQGMPTAHAAVLLFPANGALQYPGSRFFRQTATAMDGTFRFDTLPPGTYFVTCAASVALRSTDDDSWQDPETLAVLSKAARRIELRANERQALKSPLVPSP